MDILYDRKSPTHQGETDRISEKLKTNGDIFRAKMEEIFLKYSNLDDPGCDVCFETMTFRTPKGAVPLNSAKGESELEHLRSRVNAGHSLRTALESSRDEESVLAQKMDVTQETEITNQFGQSCDDSVVSVSQSCMWAESSQPQEDEDLERTLSSHGSTLLDVYPSMVHQIGEAYRRQQVTEAANAVLRRYRRKRWQSLQAQNRSLSHTLNNTVGSSFDVQNLHSGTTSSYKRMSSCPGAPAIKRNLVLSPLQNSRNPSLASTRSSQEPSPLKIIRNPSLASIRISQEHSPLKSIRNSSLASTRSNQILSPPKNIRNPPYTSTRSNQVHSPLKNIRNPSLASINISEEHSPLKSIRNSCLASTRSNQILSPPKNIRNPPYTSTRSNQVHSPLKNIRNPSLASININEEHSPLKSIRNSSLASTRSNQILSPSKNIRNPPYTSTRSNQVHSPLKNIRNPTLVSISSSEELSPLRRVRNPSFGSSACFYSPRRVEKSPEAESRTFQNSVYLHSDSETNHRPVRVLDISTASSSATSSRRSPSPDLNQTYIIQPTMMPPSYAVPASAVYSPNRSAYNSPLNEAKILSLTSRGGRSVDASPSHHCRSQFTDSFVDRKRFRDHHYSPTSSTHRSVIEGQHHSWRSPIKSRDCRLEQEEQASSSSHNPKQTMPVNLAEVYRPPYQSQQSLSSSPCGSRHLFSEHQENVPMAQGHQMSPRPKRRRSLSSHQSTSCSVSHMSSRQIDTEFRRMYHQFICRGISSSCHLCERHPERDFQSPPTFSTDMSALALTPIQSRLKKRCRPSELEEFLRQKRFRESCSLTGLSCPEPKQQQLEPTHMSTNVANPSEEKRTWNRALLLQCPSPGFLQASGSRKVSGSAQSRQIHSHSSWREARDCIGAAEARAHMSLRNQSGISFSPSSSRRRILYGPLQE